jgi:hypothetical protein
MEETTTTPAASSRKWLWIGLGVLLLIIVIGAITGFAGIPAMSGAPAGTDVDRNIDGSTTYSNEEGSVTVGSGANMPANWPSDAPTAYSGATILYSGTTNPTTGESGSAVAYTTSASVQSVFEYYRSRLTAEGWAVEGSGTMTGAGMTVITATKDSRTFGVYITSDAQGQTSVTAGVQL